MTISGWFADWPPLDGDRGEPPIVQVHLTAS